MIEQDPTKSYVHGASSTPLRKSLIIKNVDFDGNIANLKNF